MKFSTREDIEAPIDVVFRAVSDFEAFERSAMRRGAQIQRNQTEKDGREQLSWQIGFLFRGKHRVIASYMEEFTPPDRLNLASVSGGIDSDLTIDLVGLSRSRTRVVVQLDLRPRTLKARLLLQSLKLAKSSLTRRFKLRVANFAAMVEDNNGAADLR